MPLPDRKDSPAANTASDRLPGLMSRGHRNHMRRELIEGCRVMAEVYRVLEHDFHPLEEETQRVLDQWIETQ